MTTNYQIQDYDAPYEHHPVEDIEPIKDEQTAMAEMLIRIISWARYGVTSQTIAARVHVLCECLGLNSPSMTWAQISEMVSSKSFKITRAAVQLMADEVEKEFNLRSANARNNETREKCKLAQISKKK